MLSLSVLTLVAGVATCVAAVSINEDGYYDTRYNHLDIERILNNKRLVTYYGQCLTGDGPCTPQGTEFKRILPEALRTNCIRCTDRQKRTAYLAIKRLKKEYPKIWQQLQAEWDPTGELVSTFINSVESDADAVQPSEPTVTQPLTQPITQPITQPSTQPITQSSAEPVSVATSKPSAVQPGANQIMVDGRFADIDTAADNEIQAAEAPTTVPLLPSTTPTTTTTTTTESVATSTTGAPVYYSTRYIPAPPVLATEVNYRTSFRPTRFNILLPRPHELGKITVNFIGSIGDLGSKVIRTGARIADMVFSGVQAGVHATIRRPL